MQDCWGEEVSYSAERRPSNSTTPPCASATSSGLAVIASERAEIEGQLTDTTTKLDAGNTFFPTAPELLCDPQACYRRGSMGVKHALAKVIFSKLYLDMGDTALVNNHDLTPGIGGLIEAEEPQPDVLPAQRHPERLGGRHRG